MHFQERMERLRAALYAEPSAENWEAILVMINAWPPEQDLELALDYAQGALEAWPALLRGVPGDWWARLRQGEQMAAWRLVRLEVGHTHQAAQAATWLLRSPDPEANRRGLELVATDQPGARAGVWAALRLVEATPTSQVPLEEGVNQDTWELSARQGALTGALLQAAWMSLGEANAPAPLKLRSLILNQVEHMRDLTALAPLDKTQRLFLRGCPQLESLQGADRLLWLSHLQVSSASSLREAEALVQIPALHALELIACRGLESASWLSALPALRRLSLCASRCLDSLRPLRNLFDLEVLDLQMAGDFEDLSPLANLEALQGLNLSRTQVHDLSPLAHLSGLRELNLSQCSALRDFSPLSGLTGLRDLCIGGPGVAELRPVASLVNLERLRLRGCPNLVDVSALASLGQLRTLEIAEADQLESLRGLRGLESLRLLVLRNCPALRDTHTLEGLPAAVIQHR